ncbi:hypothetical protein PR048_013593 [Dryococelus australis]|uniref:Mutator-like transposase domain-containing protein n=1 Tax=Dryococelus australis TaxID=614101 RepID=A0ABQ9HU46_9NEOP|nr:hypothetical protein PR048_013593 [Dryococelus australis]
MPSTAATQWSAGGDISDVWGEVLSPMPSNNDQRHKSQGHGSNAASTLCRHAARLTHSIAAGDCFATGTKTLRARAPFMHQACTSVRLMHGSSLPFVQNRVTEPNHDLPDPQLSKGVLLIVCMQCNSVQCPIKLAGDRWHGGQLPHPHSLVLGLGGHREHKRVVWCAPLPSVFSSLTAIVMQEAGREESNSALEVGEVDEDGVPAIAVVTDGAWSKRSYGTNFNALSGVARIIGAKTKKVLFIRTRNAYCSICKRASSKDETVKQHVSKKNWTKSSTAIEADIIVEGFRNSIEMHNLKYNKVIEYRFLSEPPVYSISLADLLKPGYLRAEHSPLPPRLPQEFEQCQRQCWSGTKEKATVCPEELQLSASYTVVIIAEEDEIVDDDRGHRWLSSCVSANTVPAAIMLPVDPKILPSLRITAGNAERQQNRTSLLRVTKWVGDAVEAEVLKKNGDLVKSWAKSASE